MTTEASGSAPTTASPPLQGANPRASSNSKTSSFSRSRASRVVKNGNSNGSGRPTTSSASSVASSTSSRGRRQNGVASSTPAPNGKQTQSADVEKGADNGGVGEPSKPSRTPWYRRKFKSPLVPLLQHIPMWLEGYIFGWIGGFVGVGFVMIIFTRATAFTASNDVMHGPWTSPAIVGSFSASAVLVYGVPGSPLSQPRSFFFGQTFSALVGVIVTELFKLNSHYQINNTNHSWSLVWIAGAIATGTAILVQQGTRTIHPPAAATAVLAATSPAVETLRWRLIPVVMLTSAVMLAWAVIWNNMGRRSYPDWWFFPPESVRKTAFPGPELGPYFKKEKWQEMKKHRQSKRQKQSEVLPTTRNAGASEDWQDEPTSGLGGNRSDRAG